MTQETRKPVLAGTAALTELHKVDAKIKSYRPTTWDMAEGVVTPTGEVILAEWKNDRTGATGEFPCFR